MLRRLLSFCYAKYRAFAPLSCLNTPRPDVVTGWRRWRWLNEMRRTGRMIDPTVELRCLGDFPQRISLEKGAAVDKGAILWLGDDCGEMGSISLGQNVYVGPYCFLGSCHHLQIAENCLIGAHSYIITVNHRTDQPEQAVSAQGYRGSSIHIGKNVWIGAHVVILPGITIGDGAVVGAGAVVTKDIPPGETWVGVPAANLSK